MFNGNDWVSLLRKRPEFGDKCDWDTFYGYDWVSLLIKRPEFADKCDWKTFDGLDWAHLLYKRPMFADKCDWETFNGKDWVCLLRKRPEFADKCNWKLLNGEDWKNCYALVPISRISAMSLVGGKKSIANVPRLLMSVTGIHLMVVIGWTCYVNDLNLLVSVIGNCLMAKTG